MSSDAKIWQDGGDWFSWKGLHDGPCQSRIPHDQGDNLTNLIQDIEKCMDMKLRWIIQTYPDGKTGLSGYET